MAPAARHPGVYAVCSNADSFIQETTFVVCPPGWWQTKQHLYDGEALDCVLEPRGFDRLTEGEYEFNGSVAAGETALQQMGYFNDPVFQDYVDNLG